MVWQQWVLLAWACLRVPFGIHREVVRERKDIPPEKVNQAITIGIFVNLLFAGVVIALIVTI
jgi:hypothetical protein